MMDRAVGYCDSMQCTINKGDIYLRLPCANSIYDRGHKSTAPFYDNDIIDRADTILTANAPVAVMACL